MRYIAAYLLSTLGGNQKPTAADVSKILKSVGIEADEARIQELITKLDGQSMDTVSFVAVVWYLTVA